MLAVLAGLGAATGQAARGAEERFEAYPVGTDLGGAAGGSGWSGVWSATAGQVTVQGQSMADPNGVVSGGSQAARILPTANIANNDSIVSRTFPALSDAVYVGLLARVEGYEAGDFVQFQVSNGAVGNQNASASVGISNDANKSFFARLGQSGNTTLAPISAVDGTDYLLVARFSKENGSSTYNRADLFVNPTSADELSQTPAATRTGFDTGLTQLTLFNVRVNSLETDDTIFFDEVRVGTSFAAVVPEPAAAGLAALALPMALLRRRR